jgi:hypothetical protein
MTEPVPDPTPDPTPASKPQPVLIFMSIMTVVVIILGGLTLLDVINEKTAGIIAIVIGAINQGLAYYLKGQVVPLVDVDRYLNRDRKLIAGPAHVAPPPVIEVPGETDPR